MKTAKTNYSRPYGMEYIKGNEQPHFSIDLEAHKTYPVLARYHLWWQDGTPRHYIENAVYWWKRWKGLEVCTTWVKTPDECYNAFCSHIDKQKNEVIPEKLDELEPWLLKRKESMQARFIHAMESYGVQFIEVE